MSAVPKGWTKRITVPGGICRGRLIGLRGARATGGVLGPAQDPGRRSSDSPNILPPGPLDGEKDCRSYRGALDFQDKLDKLIPSFYLGIIVCHMQKRQSTSLVTRKEAPFISTTYLVLTCYVIRSRFPIGGSQPLEPPLYRAQGNGGKAIFCFII